MKTVYFNFSLDDIHPQSSKEGDDFGGDKDKGVFRYLLKLIELYPKIKITLFTTPNYIDKSNNRFIIRNIKRVLGLNYKNYWKNEPFKLTKHPKWCKWLNSIKNFEIAIHGHNHHNERKGLHQQEFHDLGNEESLRKIEDAEKIFREAGLKLSRGFRPPGWGYSEGMFEALKKLKIDFISLNKKDFPETSTYEVTKYKGLINVPQNIDINTKYDIIEETKKILQKGDFISAKGHISKHCNRDINENGLTEETFLNIKKLLEWLHQNYKVEFVTMEEMAKKLK